MHRHASRRRTELSPSQARVSMACVCVTWRATNTNYSSDNIHNTRLISKRAWVDGLFAGDAVCGWLLTPRWMLRDGQLNVRSRKGARHGDEPTPQHASQQRVTAGIAQSVRLGHAAHPGAPCTAWQPQASPPKGSSSRARASAEPQRAGRLHRTRRRRRPMASKTKPGAGDPHTARHGVRVTRTCCTNVVRSRPAMGMCLIAEGMM